MQQIYYFSGSGNSLYIARELHKMFPNSNLIPILSVINLDKIEVKGDSVGFVFPIHAFTLPIPVKIFLEKAIFISTSYIFAVATRGGSPCNVFEHMDSLLNKKGKKLDSHFFIDMPNNFTHVAETPTEEDIKKLNVLALKKLETIKSIVDSKRKYGEDKLNKSFFRKQILFPALSLILKRTKYLNTDKKFYANSGCTGCGICAKVCLSSRIESNSGKPYWKNDSSCIFCFACLNYCPQQAIQIRGSKSKDKGRYHHLEVTANEISKQKSPSEI